MYCSFYPKRFTICLLFTHSHILMAASYHTNPHTHHCLAEGHFDRWRGWAGIKKTTVAVRRTTWSTTWAPAIPPPLCSKYKYKRLVLDLDQDVERETVFGSGWAPHTMAEWLLLFYDLPHSRVWHRGKCTPHTMWAKTVNKYPYLGNLAWMIDGLVFKTVQLWTMKELHVHISLKPVSVVGSHTCTNELSENCESWSSSMVSWVVLKSMQIDNFTKKKFCPDLNHCMCTC